MCETMGEAIDRGSTHKKPEDNQHINGIGLHALCTPADVQQAPSMGKKEGAGRESTLALLERHGRALGNEQIGGKEGPRKACEKYPTEFRLQVKQCTLRTLSAKWQKVF